MRERDRQRHEFRGVGDGVAEHQPLVAGALQVQRVALTLDAGLVAVVDALGDVGDCAADAMFTPHEAPSKPFSEES